LKFGHLVFEICDRTDTLIAILRNRTPTGYEVGLTSDFY